MEDTALCDLSILLYFADCFLYSWRNEGLCGCPRLSLFAAKISGSWKMLGIPKCLATCAPLTSVLHSPPHSNSRHACCSDACHGSRRYYVGAVASSSPHNTGCILLGICIICTQIVNDILTGISIISSMKRPAHVALASVSLVSFALNDANAFAPSSLPVRTATALQAIPVITEAADLYSYALSNYQIPTQCATGGLLCGVGDVVAQKSEQAKEEMERVAHDIARTKHFVMKGLGGALIWSTWYRIADVLSANMCGEMAEKGVTWAASPEFEGVVRTISCIGLEQFIACPIIFALWEIPVPKLLGGAEPREIPVEVRNRLGPLLVDNAKLWTFFNVLIYNVPLELRVFASNLCDIVWQVVLSKSLASDKKVDGTAKEAA